MQKIISVEYFSFYNRMFSFILPFYLVGNFSSFLLLMIIDRNPDTNFVAYFMVICNIFILFFLLVIFLGNHKYYLVDLSIEDNIIQIDYYIWNKKKRINVDKKYFEFQKYGKKKKVLSLYFNARNLPPLAEVNRFGYA